MCNRGAIFVVLVLIVTFCDSTSSECTQLEPCVCLLPDGRYYNLSGLANEKPLNDTLKDWTVNFHPCSNVKMEMNNVMNLTNECDKDNGVSLCIQNKQILNLGTIEETRMRYSNTKKIPIFEIHHKDIMSHINIVCADKNETNFKINMSPEDMKLDAKKYYFMLSSPYGCQREPQRGLSTGSVLVILFFIFTGVYFIGGAVILKTLRGATGWEMLPNHNFWLQLPSLVRDGIIFTFNCCRADSYERI